MTNQQAPSESEKDIPVWEKRILAWDSAGSALYTIQLIKDAITKAVEEALEKVVRVIQTHDKEDDLGYCDTGGDMDYACRSECVDMALRRVAEIKKEYGAK